MGMYTHTGFSPTKAIHIKLKDCHDIFQAHAFESIGIPKAYKLRTVMQDKIEGNDYCLGCAMTDSIFLISNYLKKHAEFDRIDVHAAEYIFILNLLADHIETALYMLNVDAEYMEKEFAICQELKEWSYFLKPHTAGITPNKTEFIFENRILGTNTTGQKYVFDKHYVKAYYETKGMSGEPFKDTYAVLLLPDMACLTRQLCTALDSFISLLLSKQRYLDTVFDIQTE
jgi:hypothetical protein